MQDEPDPRDWPLPRIARGGGVRESQYDPRFGRMICRRLLDGETLKAIAADPRMPIERTIYHWLNRHPEFRAQYDAVRDHLGLARARRRAAQQAHERRVRAHDRAVAGKPARDWVSGRKSSYRWDWAAAFCDRLGRGEAAYRICRDPAMPSRTQVSTWLKTVPEFRRMYVQARRWQVQWLDFEIGVAVGMVDEKGLAWAKARVAYLEGRMGRLRAKVWRSVPE